MFIKGKMAVLKGGSLWAESVVKGSIKLSLAKHLDYWRKTIIFA